MQLYVAVREKLYITFILSSRIKQKAATSFEADALIAKTACATRLSHSAVRTVLARIPDFSTPTKARSCNTPPLKKIGNFNSSALRKLVHSFFEKGKLPTLIDILTKAKSDMNFPRGHGRLRKILLPYDSSIDGERTI